VSALPPYICSREVAPSPVAYLGAAAGSAHLVFALLAVLGGGALSALGAASGVRLVPAGSDREGRHAKATEKSFLASEDDLPEWVPSTSPLHHPQQQQQRRRQQQQQPHDLHRYPLLGDQYEALEGAAPVSLALPPEAATTSASASTSAQVRPLASTSRRLRPADGREFGPKNSGPTSSGVSGVNGELLLHFGGGGGGDNDNDTNSDSDNVDDVNGPGAGFLLANEIYHLRASNGSLEAKVERQRVELLETAKKLAALQRQVERLINDRNDVRSSL
jgi:hypothetical protein